MSRWVRQGFDPDSPLSQSFLVMATALAGDEPALQAAWEDVQRRWPGFDPVAHMASLQASDPILEAIRAVLDQGDTASLD